MRIASSEGGMRMGNVSSQQVIIGFILVCIVMLIWSIWKKELLTIVIKTAVGMGLIWIINVLIPTLAIGINLITVGVAGILGIPGIIMLYIIQTLL